MDIPLQRKEELYAEGVRLVISGDDERALDCFKKIYEVDYSFRDVQEIVEDSYDEAIDWSAKHGARIRGRGGK